MNEHVIFGETGRPGYRLYDRVLESYVIAGIWEGLTFRRGKGRWQHEQN